jgi:hypothetical protein
MKGSASELAAAGKPIPEDEMIGYIVNGLDSSYNDVIATNNGNNEITLEKFMIRSLPMIGVGICSLKPARTPGSAPLPTLLCVVAKTLDVDMHARQIAVTVVTVGVDNMKNDAVMMAPARKIAIVTTAQATVMVSSVGKTAALHGVMMVALSTAVIMGDTIVVVTVVPPLPSLT